MKARLNEKDPGEWTESEIPSLRQEIVQSENERVDLLKWKLIIVAALGAAGLGLTTKNDTAFEHIKFILALIPLVCVYVDLLLLHINLRIFVIGAFLKERGEKYEMFCAARRNIYTMEDWALKSSTRVLSLFILLAGIVVLVVLACTNWKTLFELSFVKEQLQLPKSIFPLTLIASGAVGLYLSNVFQKKYENLEKELNCTSPSILRNDQMPGPRSATGDSPVTVIHNEKLLDMIKHNYAREDIHKLTAFLTSHGTLDFPTLKNGLFSAATAGESCEYTGYTNIWVRDNIHIAFAHYVNDRIEPAVNNVCTLAEYFNKHSLRFVKIINRDITAKDPMNRPHVRFNGENLEEIDQQWAHAQNDALGYFLWLFCKLCNEDKIKVSSEDMELLALFPKYFDAIRFWEDEDSGHWEETRKNEASSIGVATAGLIELRQLLKTSGKKRQFRYQGSVVGIDLVEKLIDEGSSKLGEILPYECIQVDPLTNRKYDAALLFLIFPMNIVDQEMADTILNNVISNLQGEYGVRRYIGDSFWSPDYKKKLPPETRTADFSQDISKRGSMIERGDEAQWCIFDPIISIIYGQQYQRHPNESYFLHQQSKYLNRSLGQLTGAESIYGEFKCPELYYIENGKRVPDDATPLLWTQANLWMALHYMEKSLRLREE